MNTRKHSWGWLLAGLVLTATACSGSLKSSKPMVCSPSEPNVPLCAASTANVAASRAIGQGNELYAEGRLEAARQQYLEAVKADPKSAEAHYNLGLVHQQLGEADQMKSHFMQAANLAPGHKKIWDSPALQKYGNVPEKSPASTAAPVLPALGGIGRSSGGVLGGGY